MLNPRKIAVNILTKIERDNAYSNLALKDFLKDAELSKEDTGFVSALVYGVLDRRITLDYILSRFMKTPLKKTAPFTLNVLRTALYQIMYMDKIPESAAVNEAVKLIKKSKESRNAGFVNAVLRSALRENTELPKDDSVKSLSIRYSAPEWLVESFLNDYGLQNTVALLEESLKAAPVCLRVNNVKTDKESLLAELGKLDIAAISGEPKNSLLLEKGTDIGANALFKKGLFHVEDLASQTALSVLELKKGGRVLDMCAAPGGKSFTMAEML
ncbi:MAG: 16S rRNA (cytosine(967)-C(5))-methyltransferase RsmB, partial [Clostridia bacterium]|nr:16S rRNA (cytosine(967)-C(5))-methyltransferase RsmB [Clostridia bacterium]